MLGKGATDVLAMSVIFLVSGELGPRENPDQANPARWRTRPIFSGEPGPGPGEAGPYCSHSTETSGTEKYIFIMFETQGYRNKVLNPVHKHIGTFAVNRDLFIMF